METKQIMVVGVGGQGTLLTSRILGNMLMKMNYDVKISEVHGMSQRGGSVTTYIKYGEKVHSPTIEKGGADLILAFEKMEGYRYIEYLKIGGKMIVNEKEILPMPVIIGAAKYPENVEEKIKEKGIALSMINATGLAEKAGSVRCVNTVMLGAMSKLYSFPKEDFLSSMEEVVSEKILDMNKRAFMLGYENA